MDISTAKAEATTRTGLQHRHTNTQTHKHTDIQTHRHTNTQTHKHKHTNTQTHKHTNTQTHTHVHTLQLNPSPGNMTLSHYCTGNRLIFVLTRIMQTLNIFIY